jgi:hypothetical protein
VSGSSGDDEGSEGSLGDEVEMYDMNDPIYAAGCVEGKRAPPKFHRRVLVPVYDDAQPQRKSCFH